MAEGSWAQAQHLGSLSTQTWETGLPLAMATQGRGLTSVWPHRLPRRLESAKWA